MHSLTTKQQWLVACGLVLVMTCTRGLPVPGLEFLPAASWAVFFLAGVYLRNLLALPAFLALAVAIDGIALGWAGIAAVCMTPAYAMLAPAYAALWVAGRWYAGRHVFALRTTVPLALSVVAGAAVCELISSGSYYWFSDFFANPNFAEFIGREQRYFPAYLASMSFWVALAGLAHVGIVVIGGQTTQKPALS